ncbi:MAG: GtrA family protein [Tuberibacillus sp.]
MHHPFFRFILVGVINTIVGMSAIYLLMHLFKVNYWLSTSAGTIVGACVSYILNRTFTFKSQRSVAASLPAFFFVMVICYVASYCIGREISPMVLHHMAFISKSLVQDVAVLTGAGLYTIMNYFGQKLFVFQSSIIQKEVDS